MDTRVACVDMFRKLYSSSYPKKALDTRIYNLKKQMIAYGWDEKLVESFAKQGIYGSKFGYYELKDAKVEDVIEEEVVAVTVVEKAKPVTIEIKLPGPPPGKRGGLGR